MDQQQRINPWSQLAILLGLCSVGMIASTLLMGIISRFVLHIPVEALPETLLKPEYGALNRAFQLVSTFLVMAFPAFALWVILRRSPSRELGFSKYLSATQIVLVLLIMGAGILLGGSLATLNKLIPVPENAAVFFTTLEEEYDKNIMAIANMKNGMEFVISLTILAFFPAMFEEMFFRGALQPVMQGITKKPFIAIIITSVLFSVLHLSFYGFLTRLFLGIILGYIFYISKNLWLCVLAHFINNAFALTFLFIENSRGGITKESVNDDYPMYYGIPAAVLIIFLFTYYKKESSKVLQNCPQ